MSSLDEHGLSFADNRLTIANITSYLCPTPIQHKPPASPGPGFIYLFIYLWLYWGFVVAHGLSLVAASRGCSLVAGHGRCGGFSCGALEHRPSVTAAGLLSSWGRCLGLVAPQQVGSSQTRDGTLVPYTGKQILVYCTTREVPRPSI